jgi:hypothetical protein
MPLDLSLGQKNAFHGRRDFVAGHLAVDAFDGSFFAAGHTVPNRRILPFGQLAGRLTKPDWE